MQEHDSKQQFFTLKNQFEKLNKLRESTRKSMVNIIKGYPSLMIVGENDTAIQQEIDHAWRHLKTEIENIRKTKADLIEVEKDKELSPIEEKANNLAMDEVLEWLQEPYRSLWSWYNYFFKFLHEQDINQFCNEFEDRYVKAFNKTKEEITLNFRDSMIPNNLNDTVLDFDDFNTAQSLYFKLENLYQHYKGDLQQVPSEIVENIKNDLRVLLKDMKKIPFQKEVVEYAIERCIDQLKHQSQLNTASNLKDFITNFLSPLSTQGFEKVKESYYEKIIKENDDFLSLHPLLESGFLEYDKQTREGAMEEINELMRIKPVAFNGNLAKSIYLEQANQDTNSDLQSLTYSQAATIAWIIYVNAPLLEGEIGTTSKTITTISLKILRSEGIEEDIQPLVDLISKSNITNTDDSVWRPNLGPVIDSALEIIEALADTLTNDRTSIDTAIKNYEEQIKLVEEKPIKHARASQDPTTKFKDAEVESTSNTSIDYIGLASIFSLGENNHAISKHEECDENPGNTL
ncbi:MAG TPA: hypothetical protein DCL40_01665 [Coxiellaceae bacterium]|nr:hypothetical protein [Coxiellaceae bacterium]